MKYNKFNRWYKKIKNKYEGLRQDFLDLINFSVCKKSLKKNLKEISPKFVLKESKDL